MKSRLVDIVMWNTDSEKKVKITNFQQQTLYFSNISSISSLNNFYTRLAKYLYFDND